MAENQRVSFGPGDPHKDGELYTDPDDGRQYVLRKETAISADGRAYTCFRLEPSKGLGHVHLPAKPPRLLVDSHMHIQSANCSTLPFLRSQIGGAPLNRGMIESAGTIAGRVHDGATLRLQREIGNRISGRKDGDGQYTRNFPLFDMVAESRGNTDVVGKRFIERLDKLTTEFRTERPYKQAKDMSITGVVMTMDMEYSHIYGYFGVKIYNPIYATDADRAKSLDEDVEQDPEPVAYWYPKRRSGNRSIFMTDGSTAKDNYQEDGDTSSEFKALAQSREKQGLAGTLYGPGGTVEKRVLLDCKICEAPASEVRRYETWKKQLRNTEKAVYEGKLKLLPMFHYDPRRWQSKSKDEAFRHVGPEGLFLGFKMYTAQGYRPWDPRLANLPEFYATCQARGIPILNHCTTEGAPTHDREHFVNLVHPRDDIASDETSKLVSEAWWYPQMPGVPEGHIAVDHAPSGQTTGKTNGPGMSKKEMVDAWLDPKHTQDGRPIPKDRVVYSKQDIAKILRGEKTIEEARKKEIQDLLRRGIGAYNADANVGYFQDNFVSPFAWQKVLHRYPRLRLCLAHFGDMTDLGKIWMEEIADMMGTDPSTGKVKFPNFYADISANFAEEKFRKHFKDLINRKPHILERTLFGTDWYLCLIDGVDFMKYCKDAKKFFDDINTRYWLKITQENPCRFFRLGDADQVERIAGNIVMGKASIPSTESSEKKSVNSTTNEKAAKTLSTREERIRQIAVNPEVNRRLKIIQNAAAVFTGNST